MSQQCNFSPFVVFWKAAEREHLSSAVCSVKTGFEQAIFSLGSESRFFSFFLVLLWLLANFVGQTSLQTQVQVKVILAVMKLQNKAQKQFWGSTGATLYHWTELRSLVGSSLSARCLSYFITARITSTCILYPQCTHVIFIIYTSWQELEFGKHWKNVTSSTVWKFYFQNIMELDKTMEIGFSNLSLQYFPVMKEVQFLQCIVGLRQLSVVTLPGNRQLSGVRMVANQFIRQFLWLTAFYIQSFIDLFSLAVMITANKQTNTHTHTRETAGFHSLKKHTHKKYYQKYN